MRFAFAVWLLLTSPLSHTTGLAAEVTGAEILNHGVYAGSHELTITDTNSPTGRVQIGTLRVQTTTERIPAKIGTKFGMQFVIHGKPPGERVNLRSVFQFPRMTNAVSGTISERYEAPLRPRLEDRTCGMYWDFVEPWELALGTWTFQIFDGEKKLIEQKFVVIRR